MPGTYQPLSLHLNDCEAAVVEFPRVSIPRIVVTESVPEKETTSCRADLNQADCEAAGGMYYIFSRSSYCACP
jgi:hypothetical protein